MTIWSLGQQACGGRLTPSSAQPPVVQTHAFGVQDVSLKPDSSFMLKQHQHHHLPPTPLQLCTEPLETTPALPHYFVNIHSSICLLNHQFSSQVASSPLLFPPNSCTPVPRYSVGCCLICPDSSEH
jgi:hypothetical protein